jgi:hypothetical protein
VVREIGAKDKGMFSLRDLLHGHPVCAMAPLPMYFGQAG